MSPSTGGYSGSRRCWQTPPSSPTTRPGDRWFLDETYVKVNGTWRYVYLAVEQHDGDAGMLCSRRSSAPRSAATAGRSLTST